jgi:hypothetical protein
LNGGSTLGFFNAASIVRAYIVDSGSSPAGGSGATFVGPTILAASLATNTPGMVVEGAIGGTVDIFDVTSAGMGTKYLYVDRFGNVNAPLSLLVGALSTSSNATVWSGQADASALTIEGYTGGTQDLLDTYNQVGGTKEFWVTHTGIVDLNNEIGIYNGMVTQGMGVAPIYYATSITGQSSSTGTVNITCGGSTCPAGAYRVHIYIHCSSSGSLLTTLSWNDGSAESQGFGGPALNGYEYLTQVVYTSGSYNITFSTVVTGSVTYNMYVTLERLL